MTLDMRIGFIGSGGITSAIVRGLLSAPEFTGNVTLSVHKNREKAEALKAQFPSRIEISEDNREVAGRSDIIFIAVLPSQNEAVLRSLEFRTDQRVISVVGGAKIGDLTELYKPAMSVSRIIPLPFAARRMGPVLFYGSDPLSRELVALLGELVELSSEREFEILGPITGMMVPYYGIVAETVKWSMEKGLSFRTALDYTTYMNEALSSYMRTDCTEDVEGFLRDNSTPGGVNELALKMLREKGTYEEWSDTLDAVYDRYNSMAKNKK